MRRGPKRARALANGEVEDGDATGRGGLAGKGGDRDGAAVRQAQVLAGLEIRGGYE